MTIKYNSWNHKIIESEIQEKAWIAQCESDILSAPSTLRLIDEAADGKEIFSISPQINSKTGSTILIYLDNIRVNYEEIVDDPDVEVNYDATYLTLIKKNNVGYVIATQTLTAKVPDDIRNLLISTGNLTVEYVKQESVSCSI